jgi:D-3-phosphoglycerate dehydrogenase
MKAFGMHILAFDPYSAPEVLEEYSVEGTELEDLIKRADVITIHTPGSAETKDLIGDKELAMMKPTAFLINCARGGIVNVDALMKALKEEKIAGAAVDVYAKEPLVEDSALRNCPRLVLTPHLGASTHEAQLGVAIQLAQQIVEAFKTGLIRNALNAPSIEPELLVKMRPYLDLAEKMGRFHSQFTDRRVVKLVVKYHGSVLHFPVEHITTATVKGFMESISDETVNYVNAPIKAEERGIGISETKSSEETSYSNLITVTAVLDNGKTNCVSGTLYTPTMPRFVIINDKHFDAYPEGNIIIIENKDVPGIIGNVGTLLGEHKINVAQMTWGRTDHTDEAMTVINVDQEVTPEILENIGKLPDIVRARLIKL